MPLHVSNTIVLIIRRSKLYYTAFGIVTHCRWPSGVHKFLFYNKFIIFVYMFRTLLCLSSGGQNCITQHLVSSHYIGGSPVCTNSCFIITLLYSSTCFEHYCAYHQEVKIVLHSIWYRHTL